MAAEPKLDLCVDLSELAPNLQVPAGVSEVPLGAVKQGVKNFRLLQY